MSNRRRPQPSHAPLEALEHLRASDPVMRGLIERLGVIDVTIEPDLWWSLDDEALRGAGLSRPKVRYIKDLAQRWMDGSLDHARIPEMTDEEVIAELTKVKGIGVWTAEMILIFTLGRPDVLPVDDLGIRAAAQQLYGLPERPGKAELLRLGEPWRPWRTLASRYLWRSLGKTPIGATP